MILKTDKDISIVVVGGKQFEVKDGFIECEEEFKEVLLAHGFIEGSEIEVKPLLVGEIPSEATRPVKRGKKNG